MTILERARRLVERLSPAPICDECIAQTIAEPAVDQVQISVREFAIERGFARENDACSLCGQRTMVTTKRA